MWLVAATRASIARVGATLGPNEPEQINHEDKQWPVDMTTPPPCDVSRVTWLVTLRPPPPSHHDQCQGILACGEWTYSGLWRDLQILSSSLHTLLRRLVHCNDILLYSIHFYIHYWYILRNIFPRTWGCCGQRQLHSPCSPGSVCWVWRTAEWWTDLQGQGGQRSEVMIMRTIVCVCVLTVYLTWAAARWPPPPRRWTSWRRSSSHPPPPKLLVIAHLGHELD